MIGRKPELQSVLLAALVVSAILVACAPSTQPPALKKMKVAYTSLSGGSAPIWIPYETGIFKKHGLDVEPIFISGGPAAASALAAGEIDAFTASGMQAIEFAVAGGDLILVAAPINTLPFKLASLPEIKKVQDLKGKKVGITKLGTTAHYATLIVLEKNGMKPEDVTLIQMNGVPEILAGLQNKAAQAGMLSDPVSLQATALGFTELVNLPDYKLDYTHVGIGITRKYLKGHEDEIARFTKALVEGIAFYKQNKAKTIDIMQQYTKIDDRDLLEKSYEVYSSQFLSAVPSPTVQGLQVQIDLVAKGDARFKNVDPKTLVEPRFVKELEESGFVKQLYGGK